MTHRHRGWKVAGLVLLVLVVLVGAARLALQPLASRELHRALNRSPDVRGTFNRIELSVLRLTFVVHDLKVDQLTRDGRPLPLLTVARLESGLYWRELLRGRLVGRVELQDPKFYILAGAPTGRGQPKQHLELAQVLQHTGAFRLDHLEVRGGEVLWEDYASPGKPQLWVHGIEATVDDFATRAALARGQPSMLSLSGTVQRTGKLSVFASADPLAKGLTFAGQARLQGLKLEELGELLADKAGLVVKGGDADLSARFKSVDGRLDGTVRPVLKNPQVQQAKPGLGEALKAFLADLAVKLFSDRVPGRNAVATTIPIHGDVNHPGASTWPTVLNVVRNAFVTGLTDGLGHLPPGGGASSEEGGAKKGEGNAAARRTPPRRAGGGT